MQSGPAHDLFPVHYGELHRIARKCTRGENPLWGLEPDALVNEAWLRFASARTPIQLTGPSHFLALSARVMRRIVIDHARERDALKRDAIGEVGPMDFLTPATQRDEILAARNALAALAAESPAEAQVVRLRCFAGHSEKDCAGILGVSSRTVRRRWRSASGKLRKLVTGADEIEKES